MRRLWFAALLAVVLPASSIGSEYPGAVFLMVFPDARTTALGGCGVALDDLDANAYYNPACLATGPRAAASWTHVNWLSGLYPGMSYDHVGAACRLSGKMGLGLNVTYVQTGLTEVVTERGEYLGRYRTWDLASGVSAAYSFGHGLAAGLSAKFIYSFLVPAWVVRRNPLMPLYGDVDAATWALDAGVQYQPFNSLRLGVSIANVGYKLQYMPSGSDCRLPSLLRLGLVVKPRIPGPVQIALVGDIWRDLVSPMEWWLEGGDSTIMFWENMEHGIGLECKVADVATVRLGYFEDIVGQRGGLLVEDTNHNRHRISLLRYVFQHHNRALDIGLCWGVGLEYRGLKLDVGVDESIYDFATRNVRFQLSARL